jgi:hypothetical protein
MRRKGIFSAWEPHPGPEMMPGINELKDIFSTRIIFRK